MSSWSWSKTFFEVDAEGINSYHKPARRDKSAPRANQKLEKLKMFTPVND